MTQKQAICADLWVLSGTLAHMAHSQVPYNYPIPPGRPEGTAGGNTEKREG